VTPTTGLAFSARATGSAFGSAIHGFISNNKLSLTYLSNVGSAAVTADLPEWDMRLLLGDMTIGNTTVLAEIAAIKVIHFLLR
jgi:hypothetical protein